MIDTLNISSDIALERIPQDFADDKLTKVPVMPWYCQTTSQYPS